MSLVIIDKSFNTGTSFFCSVCKLKNLISVLILFRDGTLNSSTVLQLDPAVDGVFNGPYPIGIDPVNHFVFNLLELHIYTSMSAILSVSYKKNPQKSAVIGRPKLT